MEPGFYQDLSNAEYHKSEGISKTGLDYIAENQEGKVDERVGWTGG